jgi:TM2 domain-containing membrane protein YozV
MLGTADKKTPVNSEAARVMGDRKSCPFEYRHVKLYWRDTRAFGGRTMTDFNPGAEGLTTEELTLVETRLTNEAKSVLVAYILWIFLGGIGMHNFYIGRIMLGICEAILCLLGFIFIFAAGLGVIFLVPLAVLLFIACLSG